MNKKKRIKELEERVALLEKQIEMLKAWPAEDGDLPQPYNPYRPYDPWILRKKVYPREETRITWTWSSAEGLKRCPTP